MIKKSVKTLMNTLTPPRLNFSMSQRLNVSTNERSECLDERTK